MCPDLVQLTKEEKVICICWCSLFPGIGMITEGSGVTYCKTSVSTHILVAVTVHQYFEKLHMSCEAKVKMCINNFHQFQDFAFDHIIFIEAIGEKWQLMSCDRIN